MDLSARLEQVIRDGQEGPLEPLIPRDVRLWSLPGKADAVVGMRRVGKTSLLLAHMAKAQAAEAAAFTSSRAVQLHGGIGFTWESDVHFFFKRNKHSELLFGDAAYHKARVADLLIDG